MVLKPAVKNILLSNTNSFSFNKLVPEEDDNHTLGPTCEILFNF
jgi:hypothetical protein